ncbi:hypothetical protein M405DRAFT_838548 [Rhizopogon salebrosus TDB-379]|nr:hypothetical protein M405DRAFT_838548 [Rhizopogon salebrosus TDB-379]
MALDYPSTLRNIWCMPSVPVLYLESISDPRSRIYQEPDSRSRVIFQLASGLLNRWNAYYRPLHIFSSQTISLSATHFTAEILGGLGSIIVIRPDIWVTSNLLLSDAGTCVSAVPVRLQPHVKLKDEETCKLVGRWWDWGVVEGIGWCIEDGDLGLLDYWFVV